MVMMKSWILRRPRAFSLLRQPQLALEATNFFGCLDAIETWKLNIHEDQVKVATTPFVNSFMPVLGHVIVDAFTAEERCENPLVDHIVLDNQHLDGRKEFFPKSHFAPLDPCARLRREGWRLRWRQSRVIRPSPRLVAHADHDALLWLS